MKSSQQIRAAALHLSEKRPFDKISFADVAKAAGVHWTAVRRHFGSKQEMRKWLEAQQAASGSSLADTRTKILDAAARVFSKHGFSGTSLDLVAADAGMTKGAVYWHFSSKSDLFAALCEHQLSQQLKVLPQTGRMAFGNGNSIAAVKGLAAMLAAQFECFEPDSHAPMLFFDFVTASRDPLVADALCSAYGQIIEGTAAMIKEWQKEQLLADDVDPQAIAILFQSLINGLLLGLLIDPKRVQLPSITSQLAQLLWQGIQHKGK